ncbi:carboxyl transferase domain-containing protein [Geodermatophilus sp. SYSU D01106]
MSVTRLLVANRGEVAVRVLRTAAALGLSTVAVAPEDDAGGLHVRRADDAVRLPGAGPAAYLDVAAVVGAAVRSGADALHPGWGFLSESPALARACAGAGVVFVGPSAEALALFGDKTAARARAAGLGVPVPAATGPDPAPEEAAAFLAGGPVMVKAVSGGGGRGMRPVTDPADLPAALERCRSEARAASGDGTVYLERLLPGARHVEVQVAGDGAAVVVLGDRDCSLQRRRQKLVEVAPAPGLDGALRDRLAGWAAALCGSAGLRGLATVEFLVRGHEVAFLEVNPRLQVEHTVTEEVTGLDLVEVGIRLASGDSLAALGLSVPPPVRGAAVQVRVNAEALRRDGTVLPGAGVLGRFVPPTGRGVRVDTGVVAGDEVSPRYDSLLAKVVVHDRDLPRALAGCRRALAELDVDGVPTGRDLLAALLRLPEVAAGRATTDLVDARLADLLPDEEPAVATGPVDGVLPVTAPLSGAVVEVAAADGDAVAAGAPLLVLEAMKMEHVVPAPGAGRVTGLAARVGDVVTAGTVLAGVVPGDVDAVDGRDDGDPDAVRPELAELHERRAATLDDARPDAVARRHGAGRMTARETVAALVDEGTFVEYGQLGLAAQRARRSLEELVARTPGDGMVTGLGEVGGVACAVLAYDYTVLAGTQGHVNHRKTDRLLELAAERGLPVVLVAEGGGGRPGDTDGAGVSWLDVPTFTTMARLAGRVPTVAVVSGFCFAGNAALVGCCDVVIATEGSSIGMGGPAMIEAGGLGVVAPEDVGPTAVHAATGVVDVVVPDDAAAVAAAREALGLLAGRRRPGEAADQRPLRTALPANRVRSYDVRPVVTTLADAGSVLELRPAFGRGVVTALARLGGRPVGLLANDPRHLGGAIDGESADKAAAFLRLCGSAGLPVVSLVDTPGFMVGPESERTGTVRRFGGLYVAGAQLPVPLLAVVLRKAYGLGAMAMLGGDLRAPLLTLAWPTGEFGPMSLEGAVRLGARRELEALAPPEREARFAELVAESYAQGRALNVASVFEVDDVVDPADTREVLLRALAGLA